MQCVGAVGNGFIRSVNRVRHTECMNAFPTRGVGRFGYDEAPVRGTQCVQSVGAGLLDCPAGCIQHDNRGRANPWPVLLSPGLDENEPCTRAGGDACPYKRNRAVWFLRGTAIMDNILLNLSKTDKHIHIFPADTSVPAGNDYSFSSFSILWAQASRKRSSRF